MKKKTIALLLACMMTLGIAIGGTLAWLTDETEDVVNTFTTSNVDISISEEGSTKNPAGTAFEQSFQMIPGYTITKKPMVTVEADSEKCYLFIKVVEDGGEVTADGANKSFSDFLSYAIDSGWTPGQGTGTGLNGVPAGYYYRIVEKDATKNQDFSILVDNKVTVKTTVTKGMMDALETNTSEYPTLTFKAAAIQFNNANSTNFTPAAAFEELPDGF